MPVVRFNGKKLDPATIRALVSGTLVNGSKPSVWWNRQSIDFRNSFMDTIRTSMSNGESLTQGIARIVGGTVDGVQVPGVMKTTRGRAGALVATAQNAVANEAALRTFQENNDVIKQVTQVSTLDNRTSDICIAYSGQTWDVNTLQPVKSLGSTLPFNGGPPRHFNCRSRLRPVTKSFRELGVDADEIPAGTRASMDGQVPADITFNQFLKKKSTTFQDNLLGPKRAQLWRDDKITLTQLVDMRGNPMSLAQLEARIGIRKPVVRPPTKRPKIVEQDPDAGVKAALDAEKAKRLAAEKAAKASRQAERDEKARRIRAERAAAREKKAREAAEKKAAAEKAAREAAEKDRIAAELKRRESARPEDVLVIVDDAEAAADEINRFLIRNGFTREQIAEHVPLDLISSFNPTTAKNVLGIIKDKIAKAAARAKALAEATQAIPDTIPVFKTSKEAQEWTRKFLIRDEKLNTLFNTLQAKGPRTTRKWNRKTGNYDVTTHDDIVAWGSYDKKFFRVIAEVTSMMSKRFDMRLPNFIGVKRRHPTLRFKGGRELAAVHMETDSLLLPTTITNKKKVLQRSLWQEKSNNRSAGESGMRQLNSMLDDAKALKAQGVEFADELIEAIEDAIKKKDFPFTATSIRHEAFDALSDEKKMAMYIWDTMVHESGHRLHAQFKQRVDDVLATLFTRGGTGHLSASKNRYLWQRQVSEYATTNQHEFLAESFTRYMMGEHNRIYPPLLDLFKELDTQTIFGIEDISALFKGFT